MRRGVPNRLRVPTNPTTSSSAHSGQTSTSLWESLCSTVSRPSDSPEGGMIAVKVINHYGDEVLKVLEV